MGGEAVAIEGVFHFHAHPAFGIDIGLESGHGNGAFGGNVGAADGKVDFECHGAALELFVGGTGAGGGGGLALIEVAQGFDFEAGGVDFFSRGGAGAAFSAAFVGFGFFYGRGVVLVDDDF